VLGDSYQINSAGVATPKGHAGRLAYVSEFLDEIKRSGSMQQMLDELGLRGVNVVMQNQRPMEPPGHATIFTVATRGPGRYQYFGSRRACGPRFPQYFWTLPAAKCRKTLRAFRVKPEWQA